MENSIISKLRMLANNNAVSTNNESVDALFANDPALSGAQKRKRTVELGQDPQMAPVARKAEKLKSAVERCEAAYAELSTQLKKYGAQKRERYNEAFKSNVVTVSIPYSVKEDGVKVNHFAQVICSNKYTIQQDIILNNQVEMGEHFDRLFEVKETKHLKPNSESILRETFLTLGFDDAQIQNIMRSLVDTKRVVSAKEDYETESKDVPEGIRTVLDHSVRRQDPGLKFVTKSE